MGPCADAGGRPDEGAPAMTKTSPSSRAAQLLMPGQAAAPSGPVDANAMYLMHHAFRRDMDAFTSAVARTPVDDRATWQALAARWARFTGLLHKHHHGEDAGLWPLLLDRAHAAGDTAARAVLEAMEAQHAGLDPLLTSCTAGFERLTGHADRDARDALEVRVVALREQLRRHLADEERDAMALVQRHLGQADWDRMEDEYFKSAYGPRDMPFVVAWVLHRIPAEDLAQVRAATGRPVALLWRLWWRRGFERRERKAFRHA